MALCQLVVKEFFFNKAGEGFPIYDEWKDAFTFENLTTWRKYIDGLQTQEGLMKEPLHGFDFDEFRNFLKTLRAYMKKRIAERRTREGYVWDNKKGKWIL